ncbi:zinc-ribbon domain-containing protein [Streptomyces flavidovirens]|uniref:zinc ribbon domain-containing protein n=1 Tax=Streptomyces flavidovirens TaxID=67298 RepID=UPI00339E03FF
MPPHCPHCGTEVSDDARYCLRCGRERPQPQYVPPVPLEAMETATATPVNPPPPVHLAPVPAPGPPPSPARQNPARVWAATLTAAFLIGGGATAGVLLLSDDGTAPAQSQNDKPVVTTSDHPTGSTSSAPSAPATPTTPQESPDTPVAPQSPEAPQTQQSPEGPQTPDAPVGFRTVTDPAGFSLAVPELWSRTKAVSGQITYSGSTGMEHLLIGVVPHPPYASSYDNFLSIEKKARVNQKDFRRLRLERNTFQGRPGAIWEYTFTDKQTGETLHAIDQGYIAPNGTDYSIYTKGRDRDWQYSRKTFDTALSTWTLH